MIEILLYLGGGAFAGLLAGLLGVGGGLVIVPVLALIFSAHQFPPAHVFHLALGTSLASIVLTSVASTRAHHGRGAVNWPLVRTMAPGIAAGCLGGAWIASGLDARPLKLLFIGFEFYVGTQLLLEFAPDARRGLPGRFGCTLVAGLIGAVSSLVGIGGGALSVPFQLYCNRPMREAVGTSAALGFPIAVFGSLGYLLAGWGIAGLPPYAAGFVYLPALAGLVLASVVTAPLGAKLAHRLPAGVLKKLFAFLLYGLGLNMAFSL